jgi:hypothetical protein
MYVSRLIIGPAFYYLLDDIAYTGVFDYKSSVKSIASFTILFHSDIKSNIIYYERNTTGKDLVKYV